MILEQLFFFSACFQRYYHMSSISKPGEINQRSELLDHILLPDLIVDGGDGYPCLFAHQCKAFPGICPEPGQNLQVFPTYYRPYCRSHVIIVTSRAKDLYKCFVVNSFITFQITANNGKKGKRNR